MELLLSGYATQNKVSTIVKNWTAIQFPSLVESLTPAAKLLAYDNLPCNEIYSDLPLCLGWNFNFTAFDGRVGAPLYVEIPCYPSRQSSCSRLNQTTGVRTCYERFRSLDITPRMKQSISFRKADQYWYLARPFNPIKQASKYWKFFDILFSAITVQTRS